MDTSAVDLDLLTNNESFVLFINLIMWKCVLSDIHSLLTNLYPSLSLQDFVHRIVVILLDHWVCFLDNIQLIRMIV